MTFIRPKPNPTAISEEYWRAAREREFKIQQCASCGTHMHYARYNCVQCGSEDLAWIRASGLGTVYSYTIVRRAGHPAFVDYVPYVAAIVELDEGPRISTNIIDCNVEAVTIGMRVRVTFEEAEDGIVFPVFTPA